MRTVKHGVIDRSPEGDDGVILVWVALMLVALVGMGALAMFGSGGVEVEGLKDVAFGLAPLTDEEAAYMLNSTWAGRKLRGFRNLRPTDGAAARSVLRHLAQLAADVPELAELEINPLRVLAPGQGAFALDTRLRVR